MDEYTLLKEQSSDLEAERAVSEELTLDSIEAAYNARLAAIYADFDKAIVAIDQRYASQLQATSDEYIQEKRTDKQRLNSDLADLKQRHAAELQAAQAEQRSQWLRRKNHWRRSERRSSSNTKLNHER